MTRLVAVAMSIALGAPIAAQRPSVPRNADTNDWVAYTEQGIRLMRNQPRRALPHFQYAALLEPMSPDPWLAMHAAWWRDHPDLGRRRAEGDRLVFRLDEAREAEEWLDRAFRLNPFTALGLLFYALPPGYEYSERTQFGRGQVAFLRGQWDRAVEAFTQALERRESGWMALHWRAMARVQASDLDGALTDLEAMADSVEAFEATYTIFGYTGGAEIEYTIALLAARAGQRERAIASFEASLAQDFGNPWAHFYFGEVLWAGRDTARAVAEYEAAVGLAPTEPALRAGYGAVLLNVGRVQEACQEFERVIAVNALWARPRFNRALCLERLGLREEAIAAWEAYLTRAPRREERLIGVARERLEALR